MTNNGGQETARHQPALHNSDPLLDLKNSAAYLGLTNHRTLSVWMCKGRFKDLLTPTYIGRRVFFRKSVLENFIQARTV